MPVVETALMGDAWSNAHPGEDPVLYGSVTLTPQGAFEARSLQTFSLTYTVGRFGLDDTGAIKVVHRYSNDWGYLQTSDPTELETNRKVTFNTLTTGNFGGFDAWLESETGGHLAIHTDLVKADLPLSEIGLEDCIFRAGGLNRAIRVFRLPTRNDHSSLDQTVSIPLKPEGDNQIWVRVTTEDGFNAWSSPIFAYNTHPDPVL